MLLCKPLCQEDIVDRPRERNVSNAAGMHMADLGSSQAKFASAKAVRVN